MEILIILRVHIPPHTLNPGHSRIKGPGYTLTAKEGPCQKGAKRPQGSRKERKVKDPVLPGVYGRWSEERWAAPELLSTMDSVSFRQELNLKEINILDILLDFLCA